MIAYRLRSTGLAATILGLLAVNPTAALAEQVIFTIDHAVSTISWAGNIGQQFGGGAFVPQTPGSLSAPVSGHFLLDFDPTSPAPAQISFVGGHGYYTADTPYVGLPGIPSSPGVAAPANMLGMEMATQIKWAIRDFAWDFSSSPITANNGVFPGNQTRFTVLSGGMNTNVAGNANYAGSTDFMQTGSWSLTQPAPGNWSLTGNLSYTYGDLSAVFTATGNVTATAHFDLNNIATSVPSQVGATEPITIAGLGATPNSPAGVSITLPPLPPDSAAAGVTSVSVQQVPSLTDISQAAIEAAQANSVFTAALESVASGGPLNMQIWNVHPEGYVNGTLATLVFNYDPSLFAGIDENQLGIWHFNKLSGNWDFGGTVDVQNHTITYVTASFSEFVAGVPEPSSWVLAAIAFAAILCVSRRRAG
ncbi:MAG TPA: hypothetical protein VL175_19280 [Pirellulales bacterium]|jgi:hypothetical protein|nr:hypothetical protein [Pirellulales bacterium]